MSEQCCGTCLFWKQTIRRQTEYPRHGPYYDFNSPYEVPAKGECQFPRMPFHCRKQTEEHQGADCNVRVEK